MGTSASVRGRPADTEIVKLFFDVMYALMTMPGRSLPSLSMAAMFQFFRSASSEIRLSWRSSNSLVTDSMNRWSSPLGVPGPKA